MQLHLIFFVVPVPGEVDPTELPVGISLRKLSKVYNGKTVVNKLSAKFYHGQVTTLLGQNGAGKTTAM